MDADAHDRAVALVSHTPQLISSMVAARLEEADETAVRLCGQGIRDVTRIAASDPRMWVEILSANPGPVADVPGSTSPPTWTRRYGRCAASSPPTRTSAARAPKASRTSCGAAAAGRVRVPGKHGAAPASYEIVAVLISDRPGELAAIFADAGRAGVNIEDVRIEHATGQQAGLVQLMVEPSAAPALSAALSERGWSIRP